MIISGVFQKYFRGCFRPVTGAFQMCYKGVSRCVLGVFRYFSGGISRYLAGGTSRYFARGTLQCSVQCLDTVSNHVNYVDRNLFYIGMLPIFHKLLSPVVSIANEM